MKKTNTVLFLVGAIFMASGCSTSGKDTESARTPASGGDIGSRPGPKGWQEIHNSRITGAEWRCNDDLRTNDGAPKIKFSGLAKFPKAGSSSKSIEFNFKLDVEGKGSKPASKHDFKIVRDFADPNEIFDKNLIFDMKKEDVPASVVKSISQIELSLYVHRETQVTLRNDYRTTSVFVTCEGDWVWKQ